MVYVGHVDELEANIYQVEFLGRVDELVASRQTRYFVGQVARRGAGRPCPRDRIGSSLPETTADQQKVGIFYELLFGIRLGKLACFKLFMHNLRILFTRKLRRITFYIRIT